MAFASIIQPVPQTSEKPSASPTTASVLSMLLLSVYAAQKTHRAMRKLKRRFLWTAFKLKIKSLFKKRQEISDKTLMYILIGVVVLVIVFVSPITALVLALIALILILLGII